MTPVEILTDLQMLFRAIFTVLVLMSFAGLACLALPWMIQKIQASQERARERARERTRRTVEDDCGDQGGIPYREIPMKLTPEQKARARAAIDAMTAKAPETTINLSGLTPEQEKYIARLRTAENSFDPEYVIGGPRKVPDIGSGKPDWEIWD